MPDVKSPEEQLKTLLMQLNLRLSDSVKDIGGMMRTVARNRDAVEMEASFMVGFGETREVTIIIRPKVEEGSK